MKTDAAKNEAQRLRDESLAKLETTRAEWLKRARSAARQAWASRLRPITIEHVRAMIDIPEGFDPRIMGAVFNTPDWECVGTVNSTRKACHGRSIRQFALKCKV